MGVKEEKGGWQDQDQEGNRGSSVIMVPVEVTWVSRWGAHTQTYNILGLNEAEGFRAAF